MLKLIRRLYGRECNTVNVSPQPRGSNTTRYGRGPVGTGVVSSVAGGGIVGPNGMIAPPNHVFSPEYDDPANIEEEYGYGSPHRRGSLGRRSMGECSSTDCFELLGYLWDY